jgi:hypothetical protein
LIFYNIIVDVVPNSSDLLATTFALWPFFFLNCVSHHRWSLIWSLCPLSLYYPSMNHPIAFANIDMNSPISQPDGVTMKGWTLPAIVLESSGQGLANVSRETLDQCMHPILEGLASIDAEELLSLERVPQGTAGGAHLHSG